MEKYRLNRPRAALVAPFLCLVLLLAAAPASAQSLDEIAAELDSTGRFIEGGSVDAATSAAIDEANAAGVAYLQLDAEDSDADAQNLLNVLLASLNEANSRYQSIVLYEPNQGAWAVGNSGDPNAAINAALGSFGVGNVPQGLQEFTNVLGGGTASGASPSTTVSGGSTSSSGGGFPWLTLIIIGGLVWLGLRFMNGRKEKTKSKVAIEADRKEIKEQLKDNADRVINLGDSVIAHGDPELIRIYEEASATYQTVSTEVDDAVSAAQVDALDDQIDKAEWQFEVIEARLEGRKAPAQPTQPSLPPPPTSRSTRASDKPKSRSAMEQDESVFSDRQRQSQRRQPQPRQTRRRRSSGGLGGFARSGMGRMLMGLAFQFIMGGGLRQSRRTYGRVSGNTNSRSSRGGGIQAPRGF